MARIKTSWEARRVRHRRLRRHLLGSTDRPRLNVFRSSKHTYAQVIDDSSGKTLAAASSMEKQLSGEKVAKKEMAKKVQKKPGNVPEGAPAGIFINAQYLKDLSFENPNPLEAYKSDE